MIKKLLLSVAVTVIATSLKAQMTSEMISDTVDDLISQMTLEEKASLCSGRDSWTTKPIERLGIPSIWLADGPHGLRKAPTSDVGGYGDQHPATCFPTASALAASWDTDLIYKVGKAIAIECQSLDVNVLLGPGVNIKRSPLGGRNFEFFSEDPILGGKIAAAYIKGMQEQGVGTSLKHYALNNEEFMRMVMSSEVEERAMHEIYLPNFEIAVKEGQPWTVMASYNRINGIYGTEHKYLLTDVLKDQWGSEGIVISDWVSVIDRVAGVKAGMHIQMPGCEGVTDTLIVEAVKTGELDEAVLDELVKEILTVTLKAKELQKENVTFSVDEHHAFAKQVETESIVLLKNDNNLLPLSKDKYKKIAVIGEFAKAPRFQGNGSSEVNPTKVDTALIEITARAGKQMKVSYAPGYSLSDDNDLSLIEEAKALAEKTDIALVFIGLPQSYESEGFDRSHINIPPSQNILIEEVLKVQPNTVAVLINGSAIAMNWVNDVPAILETWLGGQAGAGATADILFGIVNPSGKLAETFPVRLEDTPSHLNFPGENRKVIYGEGIYVGYRWYESKNIEPLFPFGHGLSYTSFAYSDIKVNKDTLTDEDILEVKVNITNSGDIKGKEVIQLYIHDLNSGYDRPPKELKAFSKVELETGESKEISFELDLRDLSFYDPSIHQWVAESGDFEILIGASSADIRQKIKVNLYNSKLYPLGFDKLTFMATFMNTPETKHLVDPLMKKGFDNPEEIIGNPFLLHMPIIKYPYISGGRITEEEVLSVVEQAKDIKIHR